MSTRTRVCHSGGLLATIAMSFCLHAQAAPQALTFEQAVEKGTSLKGCPKRDISLLESVYLSDPEAGRPGKPIFLVFQAVGATDMLVIGPLASRPTEQQLQALKGRRTCVISG